MIKIEGETGLILNELIQSMQKLYVIKKDDAKVILQKALRTPEVLNILAKEVENQLLKLNGIAEHQFLKTEISTCHFCGCAIGEHDSEVCGCTGCCFGNCSECDEQC